MAAVPEEIKLPEPNTTLLEVRDKALFVVVRVLFVAKVKSPAPSASESALKVVAPFVVRLDESVIPFSEFTVRP